MGFQFIDRHRADYFAFITEREAIRRRRAAGEPQPWTQDAILRDWRLCNVFREHDRTTSWFPENVRSRLDGVPVASATVAFRFFNPRPQELEALAQVFLISPASVLMKPCAIADRSARIDARTRSGTAGRPRRRRSSS